MRDETDFQDPTLQHYNLDWVMAEIDDRNKPKAHVHNRDLYEEMVLAVLIGKMFTRMIKGLGITNEAVSIAINVPKTRIDSLAAGRLRDISTATLCKFFLEYKIVPTMFFKPVLRSFAYYQKIGVDKYIKPHQIMLKHGDNL